MPKSFKDFNTIAEIDDYIKNLVYILNEVKYLCVIYGTIDGAHHKMWVIDQTLRLVDGSEYENTIKNLLEEYDIEWDEGIAP